MKLSEHFTLNEFVTSETAMKNGFTEQYQPPLEVVNNLKKLAINIAEPIRKEFGSFSPTVAYRCKRTNDKVGGAKSSEHLIGCAFDETFIRNQKNISSEVFFWILKGGIKDFGQIIWEFGDVYNPRWLHISYNEKNQRRQVLVARKNVLGKTIYENYYSSEYFTTHRAKGLI